jgi:hypothetical protein
LLAYDELPTSSTALNCFDGVLIVLTCTIKDKEPTIPAKR